MLIMISGFLDYGCNIDTICASYATLLNLQSVGPITKELEAGPLILGWKYGVNPLQIVEESFDPTLQAALVLMHGVVAANCAYRVFGAISAQLSQMIHGPSSVKRLRCILS